MSISIKEVKSKRDLKSFIYFPFWLYKNNTQWAPEPKSQSFKTFDKKNNPIYNFADCRLYLAMKDRRVAGRVAVLANNKEFAKHRIMRFGWLDFENDKRVSTALFEAILDSAQDVEAEDIIGPTGFTDFEPQGLLTLGHQKPDGPLLPYHPAYAQKHLQEFGFEKRKELVSFEVDIMTGKKSLPEGFETKVPHSKKELEQWMLESAHKKGGETEAELFAIRLKQQISHILSFATPKYSVAIFNAKQSLIALAITERKRSKFSFYSVNKNDAAAKLIWLQLNPDTDSHTAFDSINYAFTDLGFASLGTPQLSLENQLTQNLLRHQQPLKKWLVYGIEPRDKEVT